MASTEPTGSRKRGRTRLTDQDELSPLPAKTQLPRIKRRKLNTDATSPSSPNTLSVLKRTLGGILSFGRVKENLNSNDGSGADELGDDIWEIAVSDTERRRATETVGGKVETHTELARSILGNDKAAAPIRGRGRPRKAEILRREKALSRDAARSRLGMIAHDPQDSINSNDDGEDEVEVSTKRRGSRGKGLDFKEAQLENGIASQEKHGASESLPSVDPRHSGARRSGRPRKSVDASVESANLGAKGILTPIRNGTSRSKKSVAFQDDTEVLPDVDLGFKDLPDRSSVKNAAVSAQKKQANFMKGRKPGNSSVEKSHDKAILRRQESVDDLEGLQELSSVKSKMRTVGAQNAIPLKEKGLENAAVELNDSDIACAICSGLESEEANEILLCDRCNIAVHQDCYQVLVIPDGDWLCRDCQVDKKEGELEAELDEDVVIKAVSSNLPEIEGFNQHLLHTQRILLDKLTGKKRIKLCGHDQELQKVYQVVEQTILAGEGNSMLVIGARGCGKTTLVESVLSELSTDHRENFHVIRLNGFIHTDDKLALREIWRQLGREMEVEDDLTGRTNNYADTLASLLALLSHPSEISGKHQSDRTAKSVVFILDEFDLFATHPRQTLLYNLFDIAQAKKAPIIVLGLTTRIDVMETLEKRVKSRFSHRYVNLSLPRNLSSFWEICKEGLIIDAEEFIFENFGIGNGGQDEFISFWRSMIDDLYDKDTEFKHYIQSLFYRTKSVPTFFSSCILPIANLAPRSLPLTSQSFVSASTCLATPDSKLHILPGLSDLELALLIAAARLDIILDTDTCNFAMAYDEYSSLTSRHKIQTSSTGATALGIGAKVWRRQVLLGAWERLIAYELLVPAGIGGGCAREGGMGTQMFKVDIGLEEITGSVEGLSGVMSKWCREI